MNSRERAQEVGKLKRKVTRALGKHLDPQTALSKFRRADERGRNGFRYSDEGEHAFYPRDPKGDVERVGVLVLYSAVNLWRNGDYDEAMRVNSAQNFYMASCLVTEGFRVSVEGNGQSVRVWADENTRV